MFDPPITTTGTIIDTPGTQFYSVELPNGKMAIGHVSKAHIPLHEHLKKGVKVHLELTPFDLEKARIVAICED